MFYNIKLLATGSAVAPGDACYLQATGTDQQTTWTNLTPALTGNIIQQDTVTEWLAGDTYSDSELNTAYESARSQLGVTVYSIRLKYASGTCSAASTQYIL